MGTTVKTHKFLDDAIATGIAAGIKPLGNRKTFQLFGNTSAGAGSAEVDVQASNDGVNFVVLGTLTLTLGTAITNDELIDNNAWAHVRVNLKTLTGTDAIVTCIMGAEV